MRKFFTVTGCMLLLAITTAHAQDNWSNQNPVTRPSARFGNGLAFIGGDKVLLFGGLSASGISADTWVYDLGDNTWTQQTPIGSPVARVYYSTSYIGDDKVLVFGGVLDDFNTYFGDTWIYDLGDNTWTLKSPVSNPSARSNAAMTFIGNDQVMLFGGYGPPGNLGETWVYDLSDNNWVLKNPATSPPIGGGYKLAPIGGDQFAMSGTNNIYSNDTWVYDLGDNNWTLKGPVPEPSARQLHGLVSIGTDKMMLFGGMENATQDYKSDTWVYDLSDNAWIQKTPAAAPPGLHSFGMASLNCSQVVLFGGLCSSCADFLSDQTWVYTAAESCTVNTACGPDKSFVCHNGNTLCVNNSSVPAHLAHGDQLGQCLSVQGNPGARGLLSAVSGDESISQFTVYPNPGKGIFHINTGLASGTLRVTNSSGQLVKQITLNGQQRMQLNLEQPGIYYLQLQNGKEIMTKKLLVTQ